MSRLQELQERRAYECRLRPDRALETLDEAETFLRERGMLTRTADCYLPSLFEACHEEPYAAETPGFGQWPRTKWWWSGALQERDGIYAPKIHRGKTLYLTEEMAALADPVCRGALARMEGEDPAFGRLLRHLADAGPSRVEDLRLELELKPKELKNLRFPLERCGAIVSSRLVETELLRWDQLFPEPPGGPGGLDELIVAGVRAAVVAPESDVRKWFSWSWLLEPGLVDRLFSEGRLDRPEEGWIALPEGE